MAASAWTPVDETAAKWTPVDESALQKPDAPWYKTALNRLGDIATSGLKSMNPLPNAGEHWYEAPFVTAGSPIVRTLKGQAQAEAQLAPQFIDQTKAAMSAHQKGSFIDNMTPNLLDARAGVTLASMLNPFASASVGNVNKLEDEGKGKQAAVEGLTDAGVLAAGEVAPRVVPPVAKAAIRTAVKGGEAVQSLPLPIQLIRHVPVVGHLAGVLSDIADLVPKTATAATHPATATAIQDAFTVLKNEAAQPSATFHDIPNFRVESSPQVPTNLLDAAKPAVTGPQGEFQVVPPEGTQPAAEPLPKDAYGKTAGKSNLKANQRQLASPTGSTAPDQTPVSPYPPKIAKILSTPGDISDADMATLKDYFDAAHANSKLPAKTLQSSMGNMKNYFKTAQDANPKASPKQVAQEAANLQQEDEGLAATIQAQIDLIRAGKRGVSGASQAAEVDTTPQGGHAGGGVSSVEELNRPGVNYVVSKGGNLTYQGKSFDPGSTPPGATHVTVLPNGQFRVNAGPQLTPGQGLALKRAMFEASRQ